jgi:tRNA (guanosine-2'-O-)-methyltransferase
VRGHFGIGIVAAKTPANVGTLWRSAHAMSAAFIFTVGHRYGKQASDTVKAWRSIPLFEYETSVEMVSALPKDAKLIGIEYPGDVSLPDFCHPQQAVYLLGAEDRGLSNDEKDMCDHIVTIPTDRCINVAVAGSIVIYDRIAKAGGCFK